MTYEQMYDTEAGLCDLCLLLLPILSQLRSYIVITCHLCNLFTNLYCIYYHSVCFQLDYYPSTFLRESMSDWCQPEMTFIDLSRMPSYYIMYVCMYK